MSPINGCPTCDDDSDADDDDDSDADDDDDSDADDDDDKENCREPLVDRPFVAKLPNMELPLEEVQVIERSYFDFPRPLPTLYKVPIACGILRNFRLLGVFPTCRWMADPTMPPDVKELFGGTPFFPLGEYRVAHLDIVDSSGTLFPIIIVVNIGVAGLLTGYWGGAFERIAHHPCWARFESSGELETTVTQHCNPNSKHGGSPAFTFQEYDCLDFDEDNFQVGPVPGKCRTQLEKLLGMAAEFIISLDVSMWLPQQLVEIRDISSKIERKRRAEQQRQKYRNQLRHNVCLGTIKSTE